MGKVTVRDLAKRLGVSPATVSIVLNGKEGVSEETRKRVLQEIKASGYSLPPRKVSSEKGVLVMKYYKSGFFVEENQGFLSTIIDSIEDNLRAKHIAITIFNSKSGIDRDLKAINYGDYQGLVIIGTEMMEEDYGFLQQIPIPFVVLDNIMPYFNYSCVCINNAENVWLALDYCKKCGHKELGYLGSNFFTENFKERYEAFLHYTPLLDLNFQPQHEFRVTATMLGAYRDFSKLLDQGADLPPCFFAENDTIALGVIKALQERGYRIPEDISIIGFDNINYSSISNPRLTTIHVQRESMGAQVVRQLTEQMARPEDDLFKSRITGRLVVRDSVRDLTAKTKLPRSK